MNYGFYLAGRLRTVSDSLGTVTNAYDSRNRLTTVSNAFGRFLGLGYDASRVANMIDGVGTTTYTYRGWIPRPCT